MYRLYPCYICCLSRLIKLNKEFQAHLSIMIKVRMYTLI